MNSYAQVALLILIREKMVSQLKRQEFYFGNWIKLFFKEAIMIIWRPKKDQTRDLRLVLLPLYHHMVKFTALAE